MTRAHVYIIGGVPHLHVTRPGGLAETRPMNPAEVVGLLEEVARAVLVANRRSALPSPFRDDDPPPCYVGAMGE